MECPPTTSNIKCSSFLNDKLVTFALQDSAQNLLVSETLRESASECFRKALSNGFMETFKRTLPVPGCDEETVRLALYYMATKTLLSFVDDFIADRKKPRMMYESRNTVAVRSQLALVRTWCFGDVSLMPKAHSF